jgi:hypothetical protein
MLSIAFGVSTMIQSLRPSGATTSSSASSKSLTSRGVFTLGSNTASGAQAQTAARSSGPHSLASGLTRITHSGPSFGRAENQAFSRSRAAAFASGATASSRSKMTVSQASEGILAMAFSFEAGMKSTARRGR